MSKEEENGSLHGIKVDRNASAITHLMYADDLLIMSRVDKKEAEAFQKCFERYCGWSGQTTNVAKSNVFFSRNIVGRVKNEIIDITGLSEMRSSAIYLGNAMVMGCNQSKEFRFVKERVQRRLERWRNYLLSKAGKAVLIKVVLQAIPTYTRCQPSNHQLGCARIWIELSKAFGGLHIQENGRYMALKFWDDICKLKDQVDWSLGSSMSIIWPCYLKRRGKWAVGMTLCGPRFGELNTSRGKHSLSTKSLKEPQSLEGYCGSKTSDS